ncbi:uncharacterized protein LOC115630778 [Scaptodrosophila lebanonensis]|uniref:Uncharacterized protein LOC115630778 n=1 Tax=Drosophila lebanonensis TaxID=7225 RepID=A0A6J2U6Y8_DROLE|nr:uncharacterized protein LOC115630778 [Scaptodrosophila lebanonensis]
MDTDEKKAALPSATASPSAPRALDDVDFTSGYETQYREEYSPLKPTYVQPPDKRMAWYRHWDAIMMVLFLASVFLVGTVLMAIHVFTASPVQVLIIVVAYVTVCSAAIWIEVQSIKVR